MRGVVGAAAAAAWSVGAAAAWAAPPPLADYGKLPAAQQVELSPDGSKVAYLGYVDGKRLIIVSKVGGPAVAALNAGDQKVRLIQWLDDRHVMTVTSAWIDQAAGNYMMQFSVRGNFNETQIINADTGKTFGVFFSNHKIARTTYNYFGHAVVGSHAYAYFGGQTLTGTGAAMSDFAQQSFLPMHGRVDLYQVDLDTGEAKIAQAGSERNATGWLVDASGRIVARDDYAEDAGEHHIYFGDQTLVLKDPTLEQGLAALGRTPGTVLLEGVDPDSGDWRVQELDAHGRSVDPFDGRHPRNIVTDSQGLLIGAIFGGDAPSTVLFDPARQARFDAAAKPFHGERVWLASASDDFNRLVIHTEGPGDSGTFFLVDIRARSAQALAWAYPTIMQDAVGEVRRVSWKAEDGLALEGILTLPPGRDAKTLPVVVMPHGGPQARDYLTFDWWAQAFASRGYAVFQPNFRGSSGYGRAFRDAGFGQWGRKMQTDVSDGLAELARQGVVDPKRACIVGASYGGYVALAGVTLQHGLYRCAVADAPVSDLAAMVNIAEQGAGANNAESRYWREFMGARNAGDPVLKTLSPARHAAEADAPILLIHGRQDTTVPFEQSLIMRRALDSAHKPVEFVEMPGEDHYLSKAATRTQMLEASVAFVETYDPPR